MLQDELIAARAEVLNAFNYQTPNGFFQRHLTEFEIAALSMLCRKTEPNIDVIANAVAQKLNKPILVADNAQAAQAYFVVTNKPATFRGISFQVLPNQETSSEYWMLLFDQTSGIPQGTPKIKAGLIGSGITEGNGHESEIYQLGVEFRNGILCAISLEAQRYVAPANIQLFISVAYCETEPNPVVSAFLGLGDYQVALSQGGETYTVGL